MHFIGRTLQLIGLVTLPSAIWAAQILHSEALSIGIFVGAAAIFWIGTLLQNKGQK